MAERLTDTKRRRSKDVDPREPPMSLSLKEFMTDITGKTLREGDPSGPPVSVRQQHSPSQLGTLSYTNNSFDKQEREVVRTAQTVQQAERVFGYYHIGMHLNDEMAVRSVTRPRRGHAY